MYLVTRPVVATLIAGTLGFVCYELWYLAPGWAKGTFLADFPFLVGLGAIIVFLGLAELVLNACWRFLRRGRGALREPP